MADCERSPAVPASTPDRRSSTIFFVIEGVTSRADAPRLCRRVQALLQRGDTDLVICDVDALTDPDAGTVDALARMQLTARRLGCEVRLRHASSRLHELLDLMGLRDVVPPESRVPPG